MAELENEEKIKTVVLQWGGSLFGVADLRSFKKEEILLPPAAVAQLPLAVSVGYHLSDAIMDGIDDQPTPIYFQHYQRINILLDTIGLILTTAIQSLGYDAIPIPASQIVDWQNQRSHLSHKHVAKAAGLGWIGRNNLLVTEQHGARVRLVTVLTNLPLRTNSPLSRDCGACRDCLAVCPAGAIAERQEDFNHLQCYEQLKRFSKTLRFSHHICGVCIRACRGNR